MFRISRANYSMGVSLGVALLFSAWTVLGATLYYVWKFPPLAPFVFAVLGFIFLVLVRSRRPIRLPSPILERQALIPFGVLAASLIGAVWLLTQNATTEAIRSPWEVVPLSFFLLIGLAVFACLRLAFLEKSKWIGVIGAGAIVAVALSVAAIVYPLGYGFDPFIHEAAIREIIAHGVVEPKTPYYIGAYVQIISLAKLTGISLHNLIRFFGPAIGALAIVSSAILVARRHSRYWLVPIAILLSLAIPLSHLVSTTPQGIADALALLAITIAYTSSDKKTTIASFALALATLFIHPIAGVPALIAVSILTVPRKTLGYWLLATGFAALALFPTLAFIGQTNLSPSIVLDGALTRFLTFALTAFPSPETWTFSPARTLLYAGRIFFPIIVLALSAFELFRGGKEKKAHALFLTAGATALGGALFAAFLALPGIIAYEQNIFPSRFLALGGLLLFPIALSGALRLGEPLTTTPLRRLAFSLFLSLFLPAAIYLAYPRLDPEDRSRAFNVSGPTFEAVELVHAMNPENTIVLANQTVAAAEIARHGFSRYVNGEFYVSHPSGSLDLYQFFLRATRDSSIPNAEGPTRELFAEAMETYGVNHLSFVLHDYWRRFPELVAETKKTADEVHEIDGGKVIIFEYRK